MNKRQRSRGVTVGEKSRIYRAFVIPNNAKQVKLYGRTMDVAPATQES